MKVVIQNAITHRYLSSTNKWESSITKSHQFDCPCEAASFGTRNIQPPYNVVLKFENPQYDFIFLTTEVSPGKPSGWLVEMKKRSEERMTSSRRALLETYNRIADAKTRVQNLKKSIQDLSRASVALARAKSKTLK